MGAKLWTIAVVILVLIGAGIYQYATAGFPFGPKSGDNSPIIIGDSSNIELNKKGNGHTHVWHDKGFKILNYVSDKGYQIYSVQLGTGPVQIGRASCRERV